MKCWESQLYKDRKEIGCQGQGGGGIRSDYNEYRVLGGVDENVLKLGSGNSCNTR